MWLCLGVYAIATGTLPVDSTIATKVILPLGAALRLALSLFIISVNYAHDCPMAVLEHYFKA